MTTVNATIIPQRKLGDIDIDCTIREQGVDVYTPTRHPVEQGAAITDHLYREPAAVTLEIGFSNSSAKAQGSETYILDRYQALLDLQASREPFTIVTGKRTYNNMIMASLGVTTDQETETVLGCTVSCTEIIIVHTQVTTVPPASQQKTPQETAAVQNRGAVQPQPAALSPEG